MEARLPHNKKTVIVRYKLAIASYKVRITIYKVTIVR